MRWEYRVIPWRPDSTWAGKGGMTGLSAMLTDLGINAWELIAAAPGMDGQYFIFKRPATASSEAQTSRLSLASDAPTSSQAPA